MDRFLMKVVVNYPSRKEEREIMNRISRSADSLSLSGGESIPLRKVLVPERIQRMSQIASRVYVDERVKTYILDIVFATRAPQDHRLPELERLIRFGASPRATIALLCAAQGHAFLRGRGFVNPDDVKRVAVDVLRHRVLLTFEAEAQGFTPDGIVDKILQTIPAP